MAGLEDICCHDWPDCGCPDEDTISRVPIAEQHAFVKITELIGEMAWGIGLPIDMPENTSLIFDAIYRKLKDNADYMPFVEEDRKYMRLLHENQELEKKLKDVLNKAGSF